ncbi:MAG: hypothetical protein A4E35_02049 [Methanoregula sp. PtaU1.Bin051]|nr:MAG: hypothetical protein A4E35_02049 [Methanoregula sp. PtaU1.Bin051]
MVIVIVIPSTACQYISGIDGRSVAEPLVEYPCTLHGSCATLVYSLALAVRILDGSLVKGMLYHHTLPS